MGMACTRPVDRVLATRGLEAGVEFEENRDVSKGGLLLCLPALLATGLLRNIEKYFSVVSGYYSLESIFISYAYLVLLRCKSFERIRFEAPGELGKLLGLDRIPEVKTLRKRLKAFANLGDGAGWAKDLSGYWLSQQEGVDGVYYADGHVQVYHGQKTRLPRKYVARQRLCLRAKIDYWVNDKLGRPFFAVSKVVNEGLVEVLKQDIVPRLLQEARGQSTEEELEQNPLLYRFMIVMDREGYSPALFKLMWGMRISCTTYRKYATDSWEEDEFTEYTVNGPNGEEQKMKLAERGTLIGSKKEERVWVREIRKLNDSGHQTAIITTDFINELSLVALLMFSRWSQENFFKYMMENFGLDRLVSYLLQEPEAPKKMVNPQYRELENQRKSCQSKLNNKAAKFGKMTLEEQTIEPQKMEQFLAKKAKIKEEIELMSAEIDQIKRNRDQLPRHIPYSQLPKKEQFMDLATDKKNIIDAVKMIAYRAETSMANLIKPLMNRKKDEARAVLKQIYLNDADIIPDYKNKILEVRLHNLAEAYFDKIAKGLCQELNQTETIFPGSDLKLVFKVGAG